METNIISYKLQTPSLKYNPKISGKDTSWVLENVVSVGTLISIEKNKPFIRNWPNAFQKKYQPKFRKGEPIPPAV